MTTDLNFCIVVAVATAAAAAAVVVSLFSTYARSFFCLTHSSVENE